MTFYNVSPQLLEKYENPQIVYFFFKKVILVAVLLLSARGHRGGDAKWGQGLGAETQRHHHPTCHYR